MSSVRPMQSENSVATVVDALGEHAWAIAVWAAMIGWTAVLFSVVRGAYLDFRLGRFDLGNMVQAVWSTTDGRPLEMTHGSTGEQVVRLAAARRPVPRSPRAALDRLAVPARPRPRAGRGDVPRCPAGLLAGAAPPRLGSRGRSPRARLPRVSVDRRERGRRDPPRHLRDPPLPLLRLVPRYAPPRALRVVRGRRDDDGRAHGPAHRRPRRLVRARPWQAKGGRADRGRGPRVVVRRRLLRRPPLRRGVEHVLRLLRRGGRLAAGRRANALHRSRDGAPGARRGARRRVSRLARAAAPLPLRALARARARGAPTAPREHALGLPLDERPALPQHRRRCALPRRRDRARDRAAAIAAGGRGRGRAHRLGHARARRRAVAARARPGAARKSRQPAFREARGSQGGGRARPRPRARDLQQPRRSTPLGAAPRVLGAGPRPGRVGGRRHRGVVGDETRLADPHEPSRGRQRLRPAVAPGRRVAPRLRARRRARLPRGASS